MGAFLDKPKTEKLNEHGSGNGLRYGLSSMQGWRVEMEDAHSAIVGMQNHFKDWSFFAVFDGHAGAKVSAHCSEHLLSSILATKEFCGKSSPPSLDDIKKGIKNGFLELDEKMRTIPEMVNGEDKSGSTAVCVILTPTNVVFANCGDSRGVLSRNERLVYATEDHKPMNPLEKERIQNAGGSVMIQRVNGSLAVSRALGDYEYKNVQGKGPCEQLVSPEPEISIETRSDEDEFVILACDGIWDVMGSDELCSFVRNRMQLTDNLEDICNQVVDTCLYKGSRDNMSIVIIAMNNAPKVSDEALKKEAELDARLESKIKEIIDGTETGDRVLSYVMQLLSVEEIPGLPPGGGLCAKRSKVEEIFNRLCPQPTNDSNHE